MAKEILTLNAEISNGVITVNGTAEDGMLAAAISIYSADGSSILFVETTSVNADGTFSYTLDTGARGTYVVSVADYDGGASASGNNAKTVTISEIAEDIPSAASTGAPQTGYKTTEAVAATPEANASSSISGALIFVGFLIFAAVGFTVARLIARRHAARTNRS